MIKEICLMAIFSLLLFLSPVFAQNYSCIDSNTSFFSENMTIGDDSLKIEYNETCKFGCDNTTGRCQEADVGMLEIGIMIVVILFAFLFVYMANNSNFTIQFHNFEFDPMKILFLFLSLLMILIDAGIALRLSMVSSQASVYNMLLGGYTGLMVSFTFILFMLMIYFIYAIFKTMLSIYKQRR